MNNLRWKSCLILISLVLNNLSLAGATQNPVKPVFEKCQPSQLAGLIKSEQMQLSARIFTDEELRELYQGTSELGVRLTLLYPFVFKDRVNMARLSVKCHSHLHELLEDQGLSLEDRQDLKRGWEACTKDLYAGRLPRTAQLILRCLK